MNQLMKVAACLGVSPVGNFCYIEPESSSRISLLWPMGKAAWLEILPITNLTVPWPNFSPYTGEETWIAGMTMETFIPC